MQITRNPRDQKGSPIVAGRKLFGVGESVINQQPALNLLGLLTEILLLQTADQQPSEREENENDKDVTNM